MHDPVIIENMPSNTPHLSTVKQSRKLFFGRWSKKDETGADPAAPIFQTNKKGMIKKERLPKLTKLLETSQFDAIMNILKDQFLTKKDLAPWFVKTYSMFGETCLHHVMQHRPPVELVRLMIGRFRNDYGVEYPEALLDAIQRTPLHLAVAFLCDPEITRLLTQGPVGKEIVRAADHQGRVPLHVAMSKYAMCAADKSLGKSSKRVTKRRIPQAPGDLEDDDIHTVMTATTVTLLSIDPEVTLAVDREDCTPIDYADEMSKCGTHNAMIESASHFITQHLMQAVAMAESQRSMTDFVQEEEDGTVTLEDSYTFEFEEEVLLHHHLGKTVTTQNDSKSIISGLYFSQSENLSEE